MIYDKKLICFALGCTTFVHSNTVRSLMERQISLTTDCLAESAKCLIESGCESCFSTIKDTAVPTSTDCADYVSWFNSFPVDQSCDYKTPGSALSDLAYCYFDSVTKNDNNLDCGATGSSQVCGTTAVNGTMGFDGSYELCPGSTAGVNLWFPGAGSSLNSSILWVDFYQLLGLGTTSSSSSNVSSSDSATSTGHRHLGGHRHLVDRVLKGLPLVYPKTTTTSSTSSSSSSSPSSTSSTSSSSTASSVSSSSSWSTTNSTSGSQSSSSSSSTMLLSCLWIISTPQNLTECPANDNWLSTSSYSSYSTSPASSYTSSYWSSYWGNSSSSSSSWWGNSTSSSSSSWWGNSTSSYSSSIFSWGNSTSASSPFSSIFSNLFSTSSSSWWSTSSTSSKTAFSSSFYYTLDCAASPEEITSEWYYYDDSGEHAANDVSLSCLDQ